MSSASVNAEAALGLSGMTNASELLINTVMYDKPKMLTGLNQKVRGRLPLIRFGGTRTSWPPVERQGLTHFVTLVEHGKPVSSPLKGRSTARKTIEGAGTGMWRKQMPGCNGSDRGCAVKATSPHAKAGQLPLGLSLRDCLTNLQRRECR